MANKEIVFPDYRSTSNNEFVNLINQSGEKWIIITNELHEPMLVVDGDGFLRSNILTEGYKPIKNFCDVPLVIKDENVNLGEIIKMLKKGIERHSDDPIDVDVLLFWTEGNKRIITGADLLGRLLKGI